MNRKRRLALIVLGLVAAALFIYFGLTVRQSSSSVALLDAIRMDDTARAIRCLNTGADLNVRGPWEASRSTYATLHRSPLTAILDLLKHHNPDLSEPTALMIAARHGNPAVVAELVRCGADVNAQMGERRTALMWAAGYGDAAMVKTLLDAGAQAATRDEHGDTALTLAQVNGDTQADPDILRLLSPQQPGPATAPKPAAHISSPGSGADPRKKSVPAKNPPIGDDID